MQFGLDKFFGINQQALKIHSRRSEVLAGNLANADTPGYKARDIDFKATLQQLKGEMGAGALRTTNPRHISSTGAMAGNNVDAVLGEMKYRIPSQPSLDGNTVDALKEKAAFMENALLYQTNLQFLGGKIKHLKAALKGE
ncbi:MAG TPA: flagellar basal body rod protein FlgB [Gammaproteobacteria bacterium]|nr:flagellar basal body rod protein FlgB [Gammaproteobacteria bacterium]